MKDSIVIALVIGVAAGLAMLLTCDRKGGSSSNVVRENFENGQVAVEWNYDSAGRLHGLSRQWDQDGTLRLERMFDRDKIVSVKRYDEAGKLIGEEREGKNHLLEEVPIDR